MAGEDTSDGPPVPVGFQAAPRFVILHIESPNRGGQGDSVYRTTQPARALGQLPGVTVVSGSFLSPRVHELLPLADALVLCDVVEADLLPLLRMRRRRGLPTVYEINDDFQALQPWNPTAYLSHNSLTRSLSSVLARQSDGVMFSTHHLAQRFGFLNANHGVFPNALWQLPPLPSKGQDGKVHVGWGGSIGHQGDFEHLLPLITRLLHRHQQLHFSVMGADVFRALCAALPRGRWSHRPAGSLQDFYAFLRPLDIGLCPLEDTDFNRGRSDVKFLEYAAHGAVAVAADLPPYQASLTPERGCLYANLEQLERWIAELVEHPELRRRLSAQARTYVEQDRLQAVQTPARLAFLHRAAAASAKHEEHAGPSVELTRALCNLPRPFSDSSYFQVPIGKQELELMRGLDAVRDGEAVAAAGAFRNVTAATPEFYLPWLYLGHVEPQAQEALGILDRALRLQPHSVAAQLLKADRLAQLGEPQALIDTLKRVDEAAPELGVAAARLAELATTQGDTEASAALFAAALNANPFFAAPHVQRALAAIDAGAPATVWDDLDRCALHDERFWMIRFARGRAAAAMGDNERAYQELLVALAYAPQPRPVAAQLARVAIALGRPQDAQRWLRVAKGEASA